MPADNQTNQTPHKPQDALHALSDRALADLQAKASIQCAQLLGCDQTISSSEANRRSRAILLELESFATYMREQFFSEKKNDSPPG